MAFGVKPESVYAHHEGGEGGGQTAVDRQADPECIRHHGKRAGCRRGGRERDFHDQHADGHCGGHEQTQNGAANNTGGLSGRRWPAVALRMVWQSAKKVHIPIIGMGGIETGEDAAAFMLCGAKAVMVGTANFTDPFACPRIIRELDAYCDRQNVRSCAGTGWDCWKRMDNELFQSRFER